jgi:hypothetical protein
MAANRKTAKERTKRVAWTKEHVRDLKAHSKSKTHVAKIFESDEEDGGRHPSEGPKPGNRHRPSSIARLREEVAIS